MTKSEKVPWGTVEGVVGGLVNIYRNDSVLKDFYHGSSQATI